MNDIIRQKMLLDLSKICLFPCMFEIHVSDLVKLHVHFCLCIFVDSSLETGFKIEVHDPDVPPLVHQLGIGLAPGLQAFVVLQKEQVNYLGTPWGKCKDPQAAGNTKNFSKYSDPACRIECETEHIVNECECRMPFMPS